MVTLSEEVRRRLRNTDLKHSEKEVLEIIKKFTQKMVDSGYDTGSRQEILRSGIRKYHRELAQAVREGSSIYRTRKEMNAKRELRSLVNKPWFRRMRGGVQQKLIKEGSDRMSARLVAGKEGDTLEGRDTGGDSKPKPQKEKAVPGAVKEVECVVFVPATPGSKLRDILQEKDNTISEIMGAPALKFVEKGGPTILDKVGQSDPWKGDRG